jgi:hypothetical protein
MDQQVAEQLAKVEAALAAAPEHAELHYHRAVLLTRAGRTDEARAGFLGVLALDPTHFAALNDLANLLYAADFRSAARLTYAEAVKHHPNNPVGHINLANALLADGASGPAREHFQTALRLAPGNADAHQGLANLLHQIGEFEAADWHRSRSLGQLAPIHAPFRGEGEPCRVLVLASAAGGNVPTRFILPGELFETWTVAVESLPQTLPAHEVVFNAVGDVDLAPDALFAVEAALARTDAPLVNPPDKVAKTGRAANAARLSAPFLRVPKMASVPRIEVLKVAEGFGFPVLLRSPGFHTGQHFVKVDASETLEDALASLPGEEFLVIQHLDARDAQGRWRKYRVMMIGGALYPLHLAISNDWKVHYFTAAMTDRPDHRAEEALFLDDMERAIGAPAIEALRAIQEALGLDYGGVDFGVDANGQVLFFEANATMVVNPPPPDAIWDYRRGAVTHILDAAARLFLDKAAGRSP